MQLDDFGTARTALDEGGKDLAVVTEAFRIACSLEHEAIASLMLHRAIALDPVGGRVVASVGRLRFAKCFIDNRPGHSIEVGPWKAFVMEQVSRTVYSWSGSETSLGDRRGDTDVPTFVRLLYPEP